MTARPIVLVVALVLLLPGVVAEVDTAPYDHLAFQISEIESSIEQARMSSDWQRVVGLTQELETLQSQLNEPKMSFLLDYSGAMLAYEESTYLLQQMELILPPAAISEAKSSYDSLSVRLSQAESLYAAQDYSAALPLLQNISSTLSMLPASLATASLQALTPLKDEIEHTSQVTPSVVSMLNNAKTLMTAAEISYSEASRGLSIDDTDGASEHLEQGHESSVSAFELMVRAKENGDPIGDIKWALILGPLVLIFALIFYFKFQFNRSIIKCTLSSTTAPSGKESILERVIHIANIEKLPVKMKVFDAPPRALLPKDFDIEPYHRASNNLTWEFDMQPGDKKTISYKLSVPKLDAGWKLRVSAATVSYEAGGIQKKLLGKMAEIKVI